MRCNGVVDLTVFTKRLLLHKCIHSLVNINLHFDNTLNFDGFVIVTMMNDT